MDAPPAGPCVLTIEPGGFRLSGTSTIFPLTGKPLEILRVAMSAKDTRFTAEMLNKLVWNGDNPSVETIKATVKQSRKAMRKALEVGTEFDPLPCVDYAKNLAWKLTLPV